jgi:hypothetical protein
MKSFAFEHLFTRVRRTLVRLRAHADTHTHTHTHARARAPQYPQYHCQSTSTHSPPPPPPPPLTPHTHCPGTALDLLASNRLWDECIDLVRSLANGSMMHVRVFKLLLQRMLESGVFASRALPLLQAGELDPPTFSAADVFELFEAPAAAAAPAAAHADAQVHAQAQAHTHAPPTVLCAREGDISVGSVRAYLAAKMQAQRPRDLLSPEEGLELVVDGEVHAYV